MNSRILVVGAISLVVLGTLLFSGEKDDEKVVQGVQSQVSAKDENVTVALDSQLKSMGAVEVEVTPVSVEPGSNMIFDISLNTHSVELDYDYTEIASLEDNLGNKYKALEWTGEKGGHHLSGTLSFEAVGENAENVVLTISGIDGQNAAFKWEL